MPDPTPTSADPTITCGHDPCKHTYPWSQGLSFRGHIGRLCPKCGRGDLTQPKPEPPPVVAENPVVPAPEPEKGGAQ